MTIVEVTAAPFGEGQTGGGERHAIEFIRELSRHESVIASYAVPSRRPVMSAQQILCPARFLSFPPIFSATNPLPRFESWGVIGSYLRRHRGEVEFVHVHNLRTAISTLWIFLAYLRKKDDRLRILLTDHGARFFPFPRWSLQMVDAFAPVSRQSQELLLSLARRPSCIIPTAVSAPFLAAPPLAARERTIDLLYVGRFLPWKRADRVLELAADLGRAMGRPVVTVLAGATADPAFLRLLREKSGALGISGNVRIEEGPSDATLIELYSQARIYCLASDTTDAYGRRNAVPELSPITLLEAAARGTPALASRIPACEEQVKEGITGYLVDPFGGPRTIELAQRLLTDAGIWSGLSRGARDFVERERTYSATVAQFREYLGRLREGAT